ncbi:MAG: discoidin domain-containing protein [Deltaproteobacteria bacterium]|nr:discoidin domain-containing protein [Deltaproteobacteria bacterium]
MIALLLALAAAEPVDAEAVARQGTAAPVNVVAPTPGPPTPRKVTTPLLARFAGRVTTRASSTWTGWPASRLIDGDLGTSWFSAGGDAAALGTKPWVELQFPEDVTVYKVSLLGNRESAWPKGFSIHYGQLELYDVKGNVLAAIKNEENNLLADITFALKAPQMGVRTVRFTSLMDDGDRTHWRDIALAEVLVE